eukprot:14661036-Alexandrium_andersonii.AAC.1
MAHPRPIQCGYAHTSSHARHYMHPVCDSARLDSANASAAIVGLGRLAQPEMPTMAAAAAAARSVDADAPPLLGGEAGTAGRSLRDGARLGSN